MPRRSADPAGAGTPPQRPRRILVILNPVAGRRRRARRRLCRVLAELERLGCAVTVRPTAGAGDAARLARAAEPEFDLVVAAGGDGTVNEVANGLTSSLANSLANSLGGSSRILGVLPLGTANVLARELGLPRHPKRLAALLARAAPRPIWPGRIGDRLFLCMGGIGFDAAVIARVDPALKRRFGKLAFVWAILASLVRHRPTPFTIDIDGARYRAGAAVIARTRFYAGRFVLAPAARAADPLLHVVLFPPARRGAVLCYLAAMALGVVHRMPRVAVVAGRAASLAGGGEWPAQVDGEILAACPLSIAIADQPLSVLWPEAARSARSL
ncbi:MAG TPA: YegS/Rv2252/BmrU family lipid kinase [Stellaceae bacterium]|nr:YegS/Rv2252/BmrU family lipid kinase [Stellaceae bacterium]